MGKFIKMHNWVVVGDVTNESKYAHRILKRLSNTGYNVVGVNPKETSEGVYKGLKEVPYDIEVIDLCIHPSKGIEIIKEAEKLNIRNILIQPGAGSDEIYEFCRNHDLKFEDSCVLVQLSEIGK